MAYQNTPMWIKNRIPSDMRPQAKVAMRKLLWIEYRKLTLEEKTATLIPVKRMVPLIQSIEDEPRMHIDFEMLQDFKNHYRGLVSFKNYKLVRIRTFLKELEDKANNNFISAEDWTHLMELARPELYKTPSPSALEIEILLEDYR